jgi:hypothetical protein
MAPLVLSEPYSPRPITSLQLWMRPPWRLKVYGIAYRGARPRPELVGAARSAAAGLLDEVGSRRNHYGVGFVGVHDGRGANFVIVDWWADENELHHRVYLSPTDRPGELRPAGPDDPAACVWDAAVIAYERQAWVEAVLANPAGPDLDAYLARRLTAAV